MTRPVQTGPSSVQGRSAAVVQGGKTIAGISGPGRGLADLGATEEDVCDY